MGYFDFLRRAATDTALVAEDERLPVLTERVDTLSEQLRQEQENTLLAVEAVTELESQLSERGWDPLLSAGNNTEFSRTGLGDIVTLCRLTAIANPLVKRGVSLRIAYVWGLGVQILC